MEDNDEGGHGHDNDHSEDTDGDGYDSMIMIIDIITVTIGMNSNIATISITVIIILTMNTADFNAAPAATASSAQPARRRPATPCGLPHLTKELLIVILCYFAYDVLLYIIYFIVCYTNYTAEVFRCVVAQAGCAPAT